MLQRKINKSYFVKWLDVSKKLEDKIDDNNKLFISYWKKDF